MMKVSKLMTRLNGKIVLVTGAGSGIGRAIAECFAEHGAVVYVTDINSATAETVASGIIEKGQQAVPMTVDVSLGQDVTQLIRTIEGDHGRLDVVVNNAGLNVREDFRHLSDANWEKIREVNLDGVVRIARDTFPLMQKAETASLINIASLMGHQPIRQVAAYAATKGATAALTRALAVEYAPFGIRVNSVSPGFVETALTERVLKNPFVNKALLERTPMRRFGTGEDVAKAALFFASDDSSFVTGAELLVDGGLGAGA
jgi:NAD(P)-dependent dehydrogenase (short-subunit alcohol dehydrogenase family)